MPKAVITFLVKVLRNGPLRCKTRQLENENTFLPFSSFRVSLFLCFSHLRASLIASAIIDCDVFFFAFCKKRLSCFARFCRFRVFRRFRVFVFFPFSCLAFPPFSPFSGFRVFRVPPAASPRPGHRFRVHRIFLCKIYLQIEMHDSTLKRVEAKRLLFRSARRIAKNIPLEQGS